MHEFNHNPYFKLRKCIAADQNSSDPVNVICGTKLIPHFEEEEQPDGTFSQVKPFGAELTFEIVLRRVSNSSQHNNPIIFLINTTKNTVPI